MTQTSKIIYTVVSYPKDIKSARSFDFNIYSKQSSNYEKMETYCEEIKSKHSSWAVVVLVPRDTAKAMKRTWIHHFDPFIDRRIKMNNEKSTKRARGYDDILEDEE